MSDLGYPTFRDLADAYPDWLLDRWNEMTTAEKRDEIEASLEVLDGRFAPTHYMLLWLFEQVGIEVP